jgi:aminoglycoside 6'-N-acetyltransferase I
VRLAGPGDRAEWLRMRGALWPHGREDHADEIDAALRAPADGAAVFVAARAEGGLAGLLELRLRDFAEGCTSSPVAYVEGWWVDPDVRRAGVGAALMRAAEAWARARGLSEIASDCDLDNEVSLRAHEALGFAEAVRVICLRKTLVAEGGGRG